VLGQKGTTVLFGQDSLHYGPLSGVQGTLGWWWGCEQIVGFEASGFFFCDRAVSEGFASKAGGAPLFVPISRANAGGAPGAVPITSAAAGGSIGVTSTSQLWGAEANTLANICRSCAWELDGLLGFRYLQLNEDLALDTSSTGAKTVTSTQDAFDARNQ